MQGGEFGYDKRLHVKGASEIVLDSCSHYLDENGNKKMLKDDMKSKIIQVINGYAS